MNGSDLLAKYRNTGSEQAFTDLLRTYGAGYEYHETPGGHNWQFWGKEIYPLVLKMREVLKF